MSATGHKKGDRVQFSGRWLAMNGNERTDGRKTLPDSAYRGTVLRQSDGVTTVKWDHLKTPVQFADYFLEGAHA